MGILSALRTTSQDFIATRGQIGVGWSGVAKPGELWGAYFGANHYCIDCESDITLSLPEVGVGSSQAQPGHWITINNVSQFFITIVNTSGTIIAVLAPDLSFSSIKVIANSRTSDTWTVEYDTTLLHAASFRANVDPRSNVDPATGGLLIPSGSILIDMPITIDSQDLQTSDPYIYDPLNIFAIRETQFIMRKNGRYNANFDLKIYGENGGQAEIKFAQLMRTDADMFRDTAICTSTSTFGSPIFDPVPGFMWTLSGSVMFMVDKAEVALSLKVYIEATKDVAIALGSCVCISEII